MKIFLIGLVAVVSTLITGQSDSIDEANSHYFWPEDYQQFPKDLIAQYDQRTSSPQYPTLIDNCCVNRVDFKERVFLVYFCTDLIFEIEVTLDSGEVIIYELEHGIPDCPPTKWENGLVWNVFYSEPLKFEGFSISSNTCTMNIVGNTITVDIQNGHCKYELKEYEHFFSYDAPSPLNIIEYKSTICYTNDGSNHFCFNDPEEGYSKIDVTD